MRKNNNDDDPESLVQLFDSLCVSFGDDPVIVRGEQEIPYIELQEISKILACQIHFRYRPDFVLLDCFGHAVAEAAVVIACMRLSIPFVPISMEQQAIGLKTIVQNLRKSGEVAIMAICCVQGDQDLRLGVFYDAGVHSILMVDECGYLREQLAVPDSIPKKSVPSDALYVLFTSGTSGVPKGVVGSHISTFRRLAWFRETFCPCRRIARRTPLTFVDGVTELLGALLEPASVLIVLSNPVELIEQGLNSFFQTKHNSPSQVTLIPSQLEQLFISQSCWKECLERIILSGEPCPEQLYRKTIKELPNCQLLNLYGQTETTGDVLCAVLSDLEEHRAVVNGFVSVGQPILPTVQTKIHREEENDMESIVPQGELVVSGNMSVGYLSDFVAGEPRWTEFHTGDIAFCLDGLWYIKGRKNEVEKINGMWTSPLEAEIVFEKFYSTRVACTIVGANLYALVPDKDIAADFSRERMQQATRLSLHLIPHRVFRHEIPLSGVGKVDRAGLKCIVQGLLSKQNWEHPTDDVFDSLLSSVLECPVVDQGLSFIDLGGSSATAVRLLYELRRSKLNIPDDLTALDILSVDSAKELKAIVYGTAPKKRRKKVKTPMFIPFQPVDPSIRSPKHRSVQFRACVDSGPVSADWDPGCFFMGCQGGVVQRIELSTGKTQAFYDFPGWMIQSDVVVFARSTLVFGYNRNGKGFVACLSQDLKDILWQNELEEPIKYTPIFDGESIQVVCGQLLKTFVCSSGKELSSIELPLVIASTGVITATGDSIYASSDYECSDLIARNKKEKSLSLKKPCASYLGPVYKDLLRVSSEEILIADSWGSIHLVTIPTCKSISLHVSASPLSPPEELIDGTFVVGSYSGFVYCVRKDCESAGASAELVLEWSVDVGAAVFSKPVTMPDKKSCIVCTTAGHVFQIKDGISKEICRVAGEIWSKPCILVDECKQFLVFGARDSRVHIVALDSEKS